MMFSGEPQHYPHPELRKTQAGKGGVFRLGSDLHIKAVSMCLSWGEEGGAILRLQHKLDAVGG